MIRIWHWSHLVLRRHQSSWSSPLLLCKTVWSRIVSRILILHWLSIILQSWIWWVKLKIVSVEAALVQRIMTLPGINNLRSSSNRNFWRPFTDKPRWLLRHRTILLPGRLLASVWWFVSKSILTECLLLVSRNILLVLYLRSIGSLVLLLRVHL